MVDGPVEIDDEPSPRPSTRTTLAFQMSGRPVDCACAAFTAANSTINAISPSSANKRDLVAGVDHDGVMVLPRIVNRDIASSKRTRHAR